MKILLLLSVFYCINVFAQEGPASPCVTCQPDKARTEPYNGMWWNPEQSGSGFTIESQAGKVFGVYYGYDEDGKPTWLTFLADLVPSDEPNIMWTLDAELQQFENGTCMNCAYKDPNTTDFNGTIHIDFTQKNHAILTMNNGEIQNIVPLNYSQEASADFPEHSSYQLPELEGKWSFVFKMNKPRPWSPWSYESEVFGISSKLLLNHEDGRLSVNYGFHQTDLVFEGIVCEVVENDAGESAPECYYDYYSSYVGEDDNPVRFNFSLGGLGAYEIFGESEEGHSFRAIKISSE